MALIAWLTGSPTLGVFGALVLISGHTFFLAFELALVRGLGPGEGLAAPSVVELLRAWCHECLAAPLVFLWRQPFRSGLYPDHLPEARRRGVVLVHGFVCNRGLWNQWLKSLRAEGIPFIAVNLEPVLGSIDDYVPIIGQAVEKLEALTGSPPVLVAHSMGGLAVRRWRLEQGNAERAHSVITIATPHRGTWLARWAFTTNARQMQQEGPWIAMLEAAEPPGHHATTICFYSRCDNIVFPAVTATLRGADNREIPGAAHVEMVSRPEPYTELLRQLASVAPPAAPAETH